MKKLLAMLLAVMMVLSLTVAVFAEPGDQSTDDEKVDVGDNTPEPAPAPSTDTNPPTGVALAVVPMIVAAAAAVVAKKH